MSADVTRRSVLDATHAEMGASFANFAGWRLPLRFSGELAEHEAVRKAAGLFDISHMGQLVIHEPDAATLLSHAFVGDVRRLEIGAARYTMACNGQGGILDDLLVYRLQEDEFLVICNAANRAAVLDQLGALSLGLKVEVDDSGVDRSLFSIQGPDAITVVGSRTDHPLSVPARYRVARAHLAGHEVMLARTGYTGEDGFEISVASIDAEDVWRRLLDDSAGAHALPAGLAARDSLRLEAGLPLYGHELDIKRTPFEAGLERFVDLDLDHDFVGGNALRALAYAGVQERLVGLAGETGRSARPGYTVHALDAALVGMVTSGEPSPSLHRPIAMAYVSTEHAELGATLEVDVRGRMERVEVVSLPFYKRPRNAAR